MHKIDWCEGGIQFSDTATKNVGENDLTPRMKYVMLRLDNWYRKILQEGWENTVQSMEQDLCMNRLDWVEDLNQSDRNVCRTLKTVCSRRRTMLFWMENSVERKPCKYRK